MNLNRKRIFNIIQIGNRTDVPSFAFDIFISIVILSSITVTFLQTFEEMHAHPSLHYIEFACICIFITEYALRLYTADFLYPEQPRGKALFRYIFSFYGLVDLLTIISYFVPVIFTSGIVALRMLRVIRICRLFKFTTNYDAFDIIFDVLYDKKSQIMSSVIIIILLMLMSSMLMYSIEHEAQPEAFANGFSGLWWSMSTILTVGYGDIYPVTTLGKLMAIVIAFLGVGLVAMPTGIISAGFVEHYHLEKSHHDHVQSVAAHTKSRRAAHVQPDAAQAGSPANAAPAISSAQAAAANAAAPEHIVPPSGSLSEIEKALLHKQAPQQRIYGCCPLCKTKLEGFHADYCPVCGQHLADE